MPRVADAAVAEPTLAVLGSGKVDLVVLPEGWELWRTPRFHGRRHVPPSVGNLGFEVVWLRRTLKTQHYPSPASSSSRAFTCRFTSSRRLSRSSGVSSR